MSWSAALLTKNTGIDNAQPIQDSAIGKWWNRPKPALLCATNRVFSGSVLDE